MSSRHTFTAEIWEHQGQGAWCFLTLPPADSQDLRERAAGPRRGFGAVRVRAELAGTEWETSVFPESASGCYILPVKRAVRRQAGVGPGDLVTVVVTVVDPTVTASVDPTVTAPGPSRSSRHPRMYDDADPLLHRLRGLCLGFPESDEVESHGRPLFRAGTKAFAWYGSSTGPQRLGFRPDPEERPALLADPRFAVPAYWGPAGWLDLDLAAPDVDWQEVWELLDASYRQVALARMLRVLDAR